MSLDTRPQLLTPDEYKIFDQRIHALVDVALSHVLKRLPEHGLLFEEGWGPQAYGGRKNHKFSTGAVVTDIATGQGFCLRASLCQDSYLPACGRVHLAYECFSDFDEILVRWDFRKDVLSERDLGKLDIVGKKPRLHPFDANQLLMARLADFAQPSEQVSVDLALTAGRFLTAVAKAAISAD